MLNIITSLSPSVLADDMLEKVINSWKNPFIAPTIVFTDSKTEQWFKLHMLSQRGIAMNLHTARLESFLFNLLRTNEKQSLLQHDLLRDIIAKKLLSEENGQRYIDKIKEHDNIANYLYSNDSPDGINHRHLFDFADELAMLFIEYEATRPDIDTAIPDTDWQKDLYKEIVNAGIQFDDRFYYTCPELAEKNKQENNGKIVLKKLDLPVFIFGFSGMGQTYRNLLKELSFCSDIYVYLQTPKGKSFESNDNIFSKHWAQFGKTNCKLFELENSKTTELDATYNKKTTLSKIQNAIAQDININSFDELKKDTLDYDDTLTIKSAPSKIKELELVHSSICRLLKDKNATLKDILVLAPNIDEYKSAISTVFKQVNENNTEYTFIPTCIVDYSGKNSAILDALQTLYAILHNGGLSRKNFLSLTNNTIVQNRYDISDNEVSDIFMPWITNMKVFRTHNSTNGDIDDWENAVNRLLVAMITDLPVSINGNILNPFSDFNTEEKKQLTKFVQICSDIKNGWINKYKKLPILNADGISELQLFLSKFFALENCSKTSLAKEVNVWKKVNQKLEQLKRIEQPVSTEYILLSIIDAASSVKFNTGTIFTRGVTFTSILANRVLPAKYVFLIGMSSENFPGTNNYIALDKRVREPQNGDEDIPGKNKNTFLCQLMATIDELHISFVEKDLQTDNNFYPSYILDVLSQYTGIKIQQFGIDETRPWSELNTPRERRNKRIYIGLNKDEKTTESTESTNEQTSKNLPDSVHLKEFKDYLENPLKCYANRVFGFEENDKSSQELEDIQLNNLDQAALSKALTKSILRNADKEPKYQDKEFKSILPPQPFGELEFESVKKTTKYNISLFKEYNSNTLNNENIQIETDYPINLPLCCQNKQYVLHGNILMCAHTNTDVILYVVKKDIKDAQKLFPEMYALVADNKANVCNARIVYLNTEETQATEILIKNITKKQAQEKLNEFYKRAFIEEYKNHLPYFKMVLKKSATQISTTFNTFEKYVADFSNSYARHYISNQILFDPEKDLGFSKDNYRTQVISDFIWHSELLNITATTEATEDKE